MKCAKLFLLLCAGAFLSIATADVIYLNGAAATNGDGRSWATAYNSLDSAIAVTSVDDSLWIATGTYYDGNIHIPLSSNIFGGFAGTETSFEQRDWKSNPTIISGDIGVVGDTSDNASYIISSGPYAVIDGITFQDCKMAAFRVTDPVDTIRNCTFQHNPNMAIDIASPSNGEHTYMVVEKCTFTENGYSIHSAGWGSVEVTIEGCEFRNNRTEDYGTVTFGGWGGSDITVSHSTFIGNVARNGGAVQLTTPGSGSDKKESQATFTNCTFKENSASYEGGAIYSDDSISLTGCTFIENSAEYAGGAITCYHDISLSRCTFLHNSADYDYHDIRSIGGTIKNSLFLNTSETDNYRKMIDGSFEIYHSSLYGYGKIIEGRNLWIYNSIVWSERRDPLYMSDGSESVIQHSCLNDTTYADSNGNINQNPHFVDPQGANLRLSPISPCIDAVSLLAECPTDFDGAARIDIVAIENKGSGDTPFADMGAYELQKGDQGFAPYITSAKYDTASVDSAFVYEITAIDLDNDKVYYTIEDIPSWLSLSGSTLTGSIETETVDTVVTIIASDGILKDTLDLTIHNASLVLEKNGDWTTIDTLSGLLSNYVYSIEQGESDLWIGTDRGLNRKSASGWEAYTVTSHSFPSNSVLSLNYDSQNTLWIGTYGGLVLYDGATFEKEDMKSTGSKVFAITEDSDGTMWIGKAGKHNGQGYTGCGLAKFSSAWSEYRKNPTSGRSILHTSAIVQGKEDALWLAMRSVSAGMVFVDRQLIHLKDGKWTDYADKLPTQCDVRAMVYDHSHDMLWIGTDKKGVVSYDGETWKEYGMEDGLLDSAVTSLALDSTGNLWIGTKSGLQMHDGKNLWTSYTVRDGLADNNVTTIHAGTNDTLWIGTSGGLSLFAYNGEDIPVINPKKVVTGRTSAFSYSSGTQVHFSLDLTNRGAITIYSLQGKELGTVPVSPGMQRVSCDVSQFGQGIFLYRISSGSKFVETGRFVR